MPKMISESLAIEYLQFVRDFTDSTVLPENIGLYSLCGLLGEVGEIAQLASKSYRGFSESVDSWADLPKDKLLLEFGDVIFYLVMGASDSIFCDFFSTDPVTPLQFCVLVPKCLSESKMVEACSLIFNAIEHAGFTLEQVVKANMHKLKERKNQTGSHLK